MTIDLFEEKLWDTITKRFHLTARQREVLFWTCKGLITKEIGAKLELSPKSIDGHRILLCRKLGVRYRAELYAKTFAALAEAAAAGSCAS